MKWLYSVCLVLIFAACQGMQPVDVSSIIAETAKAVDRNNDGQVTNEEIRGVKNDPTFWIALGSGILSLLGLGGAAGASRKAKQVEVETDEQWDELKRLQTKP